MNNYDGGAAFPRPFSEEGNEFSRQVSYAQTGMSLRDYFAGQAVIAIHTVNGMYQVRGERSLSYAEIASEAYTIADEMLKARNGE